MNIESFFLKFQILNFLAVNSKSISNDIKKHLKIKPEKPLSKKEKNLYRIIRSLDSSGLLDKKPIRPMIPGGPRFTLELSKNGILLINDIQMLFAGSSKKRNYRSKSGGSTTNMLREMAEDIEEIIENLLMNIIDEKDINQEKSLIIQNFKVKTVDKIIQIIK